MSTRMESGRTVERSAAVNAGLGLTAFALVKPEIVAAASWAKDKLTPQPSKIERPPGYRE